MWRDGPVTRALQNVLNQFDRHARQGTAFRGLDREDPDWRMLAAKELAGADKRCACADDTDECVDLAGGLLPDFRSGRVFMGANAGDVVELIDVETVVLSRDSQRHLHRSVNVATGNLSR